MSCTADFSVNAEPDENQPWNMFGAAQILDGKVWPPNEKEWHPVRSKTRCSDRFVALRRSCNRLRARCGASERRFRHLRQIDARFRREQEIGDKRHDGP